MIQNIYITSKIPNLASEMLVKKGYQTEINQTDKNLTHNELKNVFAKYNAVLTLMTDKIDKAIIDSTQGQLKIIANFAVGFDNIDVLAAKNKGIVVTNTPGVASQSVAEHTFALICACAKQLIEADRFVRLGKYNHWDPLAFLSSQIYGKTIGIVGLGKIGTVVGRIAYEGFKMNIVYHDIIQSPDFELLTSAKFVELHELLQDADFVTIHAPLNTHTYHLIGRQEIKIMKKTAYLINTARGQIVDQEALIAALNTQEIAGAGLDVYENEPNIPRELTILPNVVLTPHIASATIETRQSMAKIAAQNIIDVFEGRTPLGLVKVS